MRSWRPFCCGWPGLMRSMPIPSRSHHTESFERLNKALGLAKGTPLSERMPKRQAAFPEQPLERSNCRLFARGIERLAQQQVTRGMIGDRQRITVAAVAQLELALEVGTPQIIGCGALRQRRAARAMARPAAALDQAVTIEDRMDRAFGGNPDIAVEPTDQQLADLTCAPVRFVGLQPDNQTFDLLRQLVGVAHRSA